MPKRDERSKRMIIHLSHRPRFHPWLHQWLQPSFQLMFWSSSLLTGCRSSLKNSARSHKSTRGTTSSRPQPFSKTKASASKAVAQLGKPPRNSRRRNKEKRTIINRPKVNIKRVEEATNRPVLFDLKSYRVNQALTNLFSESLSVSIHFVSASRA